MSLPELCIRRPVMTTLLMAAFVIFGAFGYRSLPVSELPNVEFPTIQVQASLPGADPETMASAVATVLEGQFSTIAGIDSMTSTSATGTTRITLQFSLNRDIDAAAQDVVAAIAAAQRRLPATMPAPPTMRKVNPADFPVLFMVLSSPTLPLQTVNEYAETLLAQQISTINGVAQVLVYGSQKRAIRVQVDPNILAARGIGIDEIQRAVAQANSNLPTGQLSGPDKTLTVRATGQLIDRDSFLNQIVAVRNGAPVRLRDVGTVVESVENDKVAAWYRTDRAIILAVQRQPGVNTIEVVDQIKRILPSFMEALPASVDLSILYDRTESIKASIHEVQFTLMLAGCLVILVIFLFLRNLSATIIPSLALPISIIGTFGVMAALGYSLDNLSLLALTLAVGYVVDDAIVMLENIVRHIEQGKKPMEAALVGSREIAFTIVSMTVSLVAVFIPVMFMGGVVGRLLHEFAVTIAAAIAVSGIVSVTLTPMMCSRFLRAHHGERHGALYRASEWVFNALLRLYDSGLKWCLSTSFFGLRFKSRWAPSNKFFVFAVFIASILGTVHLFRVVQKDFLPLEDTGRVSVFTIGAQDASFEAMMGLQQRLAEILLRNPNIDGFMSSVGAGGPRASANSGTLFIRLKPMDRREKRPDGSPKKAQDIVVEIRRAAAAVAGLNVFPQVPPTIQLGGTISRGAYQFTLQSLDLDTLYEWAGKFEQAVRAARLPDGRALFADVGSDLDISSPNVIITIDRNKAATLGVSAEQIQGALNLAYGSQQISTIYTSNNQYQVIAEVKKEFRNDRRALEKLYVRSSSGQLVPLGALSTVRNDVGPLTINHSGQLPAVTVSFNLPPDVSLGTAIERLKAIEREIRLPATISTTLQGTAQAFEKSTQGLGVLLLMAILVVYIVLGILYESFIHPLTILSGLPSAAVGALLTLMVFETPLSLYAFVGVIMLVGIVKKNAIMMIDFALEKMRGDGKVDAEQAIYEACLVRFRPIMMTTMAALLGTLPIALAAGGGSEARIPLGLAVVGGLAVSQILTLFLTPVIFIYLDRLQHWRPFDRQKTAPPPQPAPAPAE
ncbi:MAG: efflux RND transporter permease subunit [Candidatus Odyssella sp.]|nr:efflux RND transporter permease subunit [Candidatus Odyssella sp.]